MLDTQRTAHEEAKQTAPQRRELCLAVIEASPGGLTAHEVANAVGLDINCVRPRLTELKQRRQIKDSGKRRPTTGNKTAAVWVVYEEGETNGDT